MGVTTNFGGRDRDRFAAGDRSQTHVSSIHLSVIRRDDDTSA